MERCSSVCSSRWCFREHSIERKNLSTQNCPPPPNFTLTPVCEYLLFTFLSICPSNRHTSLVQPTLAVWGGFTIRRPPTMAEILGFVGAKLKKSVPPSCTELSFRPSVRPPSKPRVSNVKDHTRRERSQTGLPQGPNRHLKHVVTTQ